ncbi:hypothetical protein QJQ45_011034 [Haematococcus lacustris]|nr:hypothetical protein QJQ45_011034 [Haematococcus lacustris]
MTKKQRKGSDKHKKDPGKKQKECFVKLYTKAARARLGWSGEEAQIYIKLACLNAGSPELQATDLDKEHVADLKKEAAKQQGSLLDTLPLPCRMRHAVHVCRAFTTEPALSKHWDMRFSTGKLADKGFQFERTLEADGVSVYVHYTRPLPPPPAPTPAPGSSNNSPSAAAAAAHAVGLPHIGKGIAEQREFVFDPATQIGMGIDPGDTQAVSAVPRDQETGRLVAGLASSAGTSLEANLKHTTVTLATWVAVWEVYLDPRRARQWMRLYRAQDRALEQFFKKLGEEVVEVSIERHQCPKQFVVFFGAAGIGTRGGWGADAVLQACCKVVSRPRGTDQLRSRVVLVDKHRTTRVSSVVNGQQPYGEELNPEQPTRRADWKPPAGQMDLRLLRPATSQQRDQPVRGPVAAPRKTPQAPFSSQEATLAAASEPGPSTPQPPQPRNHSQAGGWTGTAVQH